MASDEQSPDEPGRSYAVPPQLRPTSPWDGLSSYQRDVARDMHRAAPEIPLLVVRAAVSWIRMGELSRHYGVAFSVAYSLRAALREGVLGLTADDTVIHIGGENPAVARIAEAARSPK